MTDNERFAKITLQDKLCEERNTIANAIAITAIHHLKKDPNAEIGSLNVLLERFEIVYNEFYKLEDELYGYHDDDWTAQ